MGGPEDPKKFDKKKVAEVIKESTQSPIFEATEELISSLEARLSPAERARYDELYRQLDKLSEEDASRFMAQHNFLVQEMWNLLTKKKDVSKTN